MFSTTSTWLLNFEEGGCVTQLWSHKTLAVKDSKVQKKIDKMESDVCGYSKFGYCKYKSNCKKIHLVQLCEDLDKFKNIKTCKLRHPKGCKKFAVGQCRFGEECEYHHKDKTKSNEQCICKDKVYKLEIKIETMALKILALETE